MSWGNPVTTPGEHVATVQAVVTVARRDVRPRAGPISNPGASASRCLFFGVNGVAVRTSSVDNYSFLSNALSMPVV